MRAFVFIALVAWCSLIRAQDAPFEKLYVLGIKEYRSLNIPDTQLDYSENFGAIQNDSALAKQEQFFNSLKIKLSDFKPGSLSAENSIKYKHLLFEIDQNLERIRLEKKWNASGKNTPAKGLYNMTDYAEWYGYYVKHFTGLNISSEEVFETGQKEVKKAQDEIKTLRRTLGYNSDTEFYDELKKDKFFISTKHTIVDRFKMIDSIVRKNLGSLFINYNIPRIEAMEWAGANASTPPGIYLSKNDNPYGVDVFQFNFATQRYNKRCMEWLYMHEAIPGHHLQSTFRKNDNGFFYFGTSEGWACYVEDFGKELGLYKDLFSELGKIEWNLVRSARLVMEVGIHYKGWSFEEALKYWKDNITGQDEIAEREIRRITKWPGQALCYKIGALTIQKIVANKLTEGKSIKEAHHFMLEHSQYPLQALL